LNLLLNDQGINKCLDSVAERAGLRALWMASLQSQSELANILGVSPDQLLNRTARRPHPSSVRGPKAELLRDLHERITTEVEAAAVVIGNRFLRELNQLFDKIQQSAEPVAESLMRFVREELQLPWPWLVLELQEALYRAIVGSIFDCKFHIKYRVDPPER